MKTHGNTFEICTKQCLEENKVLILILIKKTRLTVNNLKAQIKKLEKIHKKKHSDRKLVN